MRGVMLISFLAITGILQAQVVTDSLSVLERKGQSTEAFALFVKNYTEDPGVRYRRSRSSLSDIALSFDNDSKIDQVSPAYGKGHSLGRIQVNSFLHTSSSTLTWGGASYTRGVIRSVRWNSSSDYNRIYPYFQADDVGGDISHEKYDFFGGVGKNVFNSQVGIELNYRAQHEYRAKDPRPRNIVADFGLRGGISRQLFSSYVIGVGVGVEIYKQTNNVANYHPIGAVSQMLMSGLGNMMNRFNSAEVSVYYRGRSLSGRLSLLPAERNGAYFTLLYRQMRMERILSTLNEIPINTLLLYDTMADLGFWSDGGKGWLWGMNASFYYGARRGNDNIIGDPAGGEYPIEGKLPMFGEDRWGGEVSIALEKGTAWKTAIIPTFSYHGRIAATAYPEKKFTDQNIGVGIQARLAYQSKKAIYSLNCKSRYEHHFTSSLHIPRASTQGAVLSYLDHTFDQLTSNRWSFFISPEYVHGLSRKSALRYAIAYQYVAMRNGNRQHQFTATIGFIF